MIVSKGVLVIVIAEKIIIIRRKTAITKGFGRNRQISALKKLEMAVIIAPYSSDKFMFSHHNY